MIQPHDREVWIYVKVAEAFSSYVTRDN